MSWLAILLALASLGGAPAKPVSKQCKASKTVHAAQKNCKVKKKPKPKLKPQATPTPTPKPTTPGRRATLTPRRRDAPRDADARPRPRSRAHADAHADRDPGLSERTGVDLDEWVVRSSYRTLAAGTIDFNAANLGEDDHNLSVRAAARSTAGWTSPRATRTRSSSPSRPGPTRSTARCRATRRRG